MHSHFGLLFTITISFLLTWRLLWTIFNLTTIWMTSRLHLCLTSQRLSKCAPLTKATKVTICQHIFIWNQRIILDGDSIEYLENPLCVGSAFSDDCKTIKTFLSDRRRADLRSARNRVTTLLSLGALGKPKTIGDVPLVSNFHRSLDIGQSAKLITIVLTTHQISKTFKISYKKYSLTVGTASPGLCRLSSLPSLLPISIWAWCIR